MLLTTGQAAQEIGCAITTFRRLVRAGLLPDLSWHGVRVMVPLATVQALAARPDAPLHCLAVPEIAVLRVDAAQRVTDVDRQWIGFSTALSPEDLLKALRGWWRCDPAAMATGGVLPVTLSSYVVAVLTGLERWEKNEHGRHVFPDARLAGYVTDLTVPVKELTATATADREIAELLLGTRLVSHSGGAIAYVTTTTTD
ncbi:DNA-binding protein [Streptomyces sp. NPDC056486]|uniref:DNA-binding protein n=1 Tax=Streptomyces sp. NPDC056486 TaxID=3345835 RepID=UPI0036CE9662